MAEWRTGRDLWRRLAAGGICLLLSGAAPAAAQSPANAPPPARPGAAAPAPGGSDNGDSAALTGPQGESPGVAAGQSSGAPSSGGDRAAPLRVAPAGTDIVTEALAQAVLTVDQDAIYRQSRWGQRAQTEIAAQSRQVAADNDKAFAALVADEDALTAARATLSPEEFRRRATVFDERVTAVRRERDAARTALNAVAERDRALFFRSAAPVLGRIMETRGALVVLDQRSVLISDERIDVTAATIAALDAALGDGAAVIAAAVAAERAAAEEGGASTANPPAAPDTPAAGGPATDGAATQQPGPGQLGSGAAPGASGADESAAEQSETAAGVPAKPVSDGAAAAPPLRPHGARP